MDDVIDLNWKIYRNYIDSHKVAVVCSARSGSTKALGTTNLLLCAASEALKINEPAPAVLPGYHVTVDLIRSEHLAAARSAVRDPEILKELQDEIERDCEWLRNFLLAAKVCLTQIYISFVI